MPTLERSFGFIPIIPSGNDPVEQRIFHQLGALIFRCSVPHAMLFSGIDGVGKRTAAISFAMACNCDETESFHRLESSTVGQRSVPIPCGKCRSCRKIEKGVHPDIHFVEPERSLIRIEAIRELCLKLTMKPLQARTKFAVITEAHAMNPEAGNALLKMLEEPPENTVLILTADRKSDLLPTIVSRCRHFRFHPVALGKIEGILVDKYALDDKDAGIIAGLSNGSYGRAFAMVQKERANRFLENRNRLFFTVGFANASSSNKGLVADILAFSEKLAAAKDDLPEILDMLESWFRDLMVAKFVPENIENKDFEDSIRNESKGITEKEILDRIDAVQNARRHLKGNANPRLTMDRLMLRLIS